MALAPRMMPDTELGKHAVAGYSRYLGISAADFMQSMTSPPIRTFFGWAWKLYGGFRLVPTAANRQSAFAAYSRTRADAPWAAHSIHVLSLEQDTISALTLFAKPASPRLFDAFGLPLILPDAASAELLSARHHS